MGIWEAFFAPKEEIPAVPPRPNVPYVVQVMGSEFLLSMRTQEGDRFIVQRWNPEPVKIDGKWTYEKVVVARAEVIDGGSQNYAYSTLKVLEGMDVRQNDWAVFTSERDLPAHLTPNSNRKDKAARSVVDSARNLLVGIDIGVVGVTNGEVLVAALRESIKKFDEA